MISLSDFLEKQLNQKVNIFEYKDQQIKPNENIVVLNNKTYLIEILDNNKSQNICGYTYLFYQTNLDFNMLDKVVSNLFDEIKTFNKNNFLVLTSKYKLNIDNSILSVIESETYQNTNIIDFGMIKNYEEFNSKLNKIKELYQYISLDNTSNKLINLNDFTIYNLVNSLQNDFFEFTNIEKFNSIDETLITTGIKFIENDLNISKTSSNLYLHRNTLSYRLDKIKEILNLDLRNFKDALIFYLTSKHILFKHRK